MCFFYIKYVFIRILDAESVAALQPQVAKLSGVGYVSSKAL